LPRCRADEFATLIVDTLTEEMPAFPRSSQRRSSFPPRAPCPVVIESCTASANPAQPAKERLFPVNDAHTTGGRVHTGFKFEAFAPAHTALLITQAGQ
jgi:hypothetical protein